MHMKWPKVGEGYLNNLRNVLSEYIDHNYYTNQKDAYLCWLSG